MTPGDPRDIQPKKLPLWAGFAFLIRDSIRMWAKNSAKVPVTLPALPVST